MNLGIRLSAEIGAGNASLHFNLHLEAILELLVVKEDIVWSIGRDIVATQSEATRSAFPSSLL
jgi:hypothetical protein